jgi:imidazolonepropionase-like amidohydrolase
MQRIDADLLIPGRGAPVSAGTVILDGDRISYAGPASAAPDTPGAVTHRAPVVLPGLWDCHGHYFGQKTHAWEAIPLEPLALRAARCARDLRATLDAGVTSVREVGGLGVHLARAVAEGTLDGPTIYGAGAVLSATGGHGDIHSYPLAWFEDFCRSDGLFRLADGPAECARAVREQLRVNARVIKVCASRGVLSAVDDPIHQQLTMDELRAIVEVAGLAERAVAAHCHGKPGIMAALAAGVRTIEPLEAIEAATATAPATLGPQAPLSGQLAAGYDADVITVSADPVADISVLASPENVTGVWIRGRQVKGQPGR